VPRSWRVGTLTYSLAGLLVLFAWLLLGDFGYWMRERSAAPVAQLMLKKFQASDLFTGVFLLTIPWTVILILGPVVSYWSDHYRSRWGRRIPFLLASAPITTFSIIGLAFSPAVGRWLHGLLGLAPERINFTILAVMCACWTFFEIGVVIANAIFNGLINDVVPRELLGRFFGLFRMVSLGAGVLFNYRIIGQAEQHYSIILVGIGLIYGVGMALMCWRVKEGDYPPPAQSGASDRHPVIRVLGDYWRDCLVKPYYLMTFAFIGLANLAFVPVNTFSIYAAKSFNMTMETYGRYLVVTYLCSFVIAFPIGWLADKFHPLRATLAALVLYAGVMAAGFAGIGDDTSFGVVFLAHGVLAGVYFTGVAALPQMLFPKEKFTQFAAAAGMVAAVFNMAMGPVLGALLDGLGGDYRYVFLAGSVLAIGSLVLGVVIHVQWKKLGGKAAYVAPA